MTKIKKSAKKSKIVTELQTEIEDLKERMNKATSQLTLVAMFNSCTTSDQQLIDQAVRYLQGRNYYKYVAEVEAEWHHPDNYWHSGQYDY